MELLINERWGTVLHDNFWDLVDARVVCQQLGYQTAIIELDNYFDGFESGQIWMSHVQCTGNEISISTCKHNSTSEKHYLGDVGVVCGGKKKQLLVLQLIRKFK